LSLVLFDIDGTLLLSGGAGVRAMTIAFASTFGVRGAFDGIHIAGRTDTFLLSEALERAGVADTPETHARFRAAYLEALPIEIEKPGTGRRGIMPGVVELLAALRRDRDFHLALLTGNYEPAARIKLECFGLGSYFDWGVFGEESPDRNHLGRIAMTRAIERNVPAHACEAAFVIGDTPDDIACARAAGACAIGVATGSFSVGELDAAGADHALGDLSDTRAVMGILQERKRRGR